MVRYLAQALVASTALIACAPVNVETSAISRARAEQFQAASVPSLCATYAAEGTSLEDRLRLEAELARRGVESCPTGEIGRQSAALYGTSRYARASTGTATSDQDYDCSDFPSSASAQVFFLAAGGPTSDPYGLDRDGDGLACEWGPAARRLATRPIVQARQTFPARTAYTAPRRTSGSRCYTGPRGGTYTITASGNKNYSGC